MSEKLDVVVEAQMQWGMSLSDDQKAALRADRTKLKEDGEHKAAIVAAYTQLMTESDADANGRLDLQEFGVFLRKVSEAEAARGLPARSWTDDSVATTYAYFNEADETDGVTPEQFWTQFRAMTAKITAILQAAQ